MSSGSGYTPLKVDRSKCTLTKMKKGKQKLRFPATRWEDGRKISGDLYEIIKPGAIPKVLDRYFEWDEPYLIDQQEDDE